MTQTDTQENARERQPWMSGVLEAMRTVPSISRAAKTAGVSRRTIQRYMQSDEAFAVEMDDARQEALDTLEEVILMRARQGQPLKKTTTTTMPDGTKKVIVEESAHVSDTLAMFYLKRWRPEYRDSFEVTGRGGGPIQVESLDQIDRRLAELAAEMGAKHQSPDPS